MNAAPTSSLRQLQHNEMKPNINDLKQLFDDSKRLNVEKMQQQQQMQSHLLHQKSNYYDAKPSFLENEMLLDCKNRADFERVKQKFDAKSPQSSQSNMKIPTVSNKYSQSSIPSASSSSSKPQNSNLLRKHQNNSGSKASNIPVNINETIQFFDNDPRSQKNVYAGKKQNDLDDENCAENLNIDSLDVSDDEADVSITFLFD